MASYCGISFFPKNLSLKNYEGLKLFKLIDYEVLKSKITYLRQGYSSDKEN